MGRSCSAYRPLTNHQQRKFGLGRSAERHSNRARRARKFGPSPTPLEAMQNPDWRAQRHRQGRRCEASRTAQQNSQSEARPRSPLGEPTPPDEPDCCSKTAIADRAPLRRPPRRDALRLLLPASTLSETSRAPGPKNFPPPCYARRSLSARLGDSFYFAKSEIVESLLRRGARVPLGTRKLELARQQAKTALTPGGRCLPALGMGHSGEKTFFGRAPGRFILFCS